MEFLNKRECLKLFCACELSHSLRSILTVPFICAATPMRLVSEGGRRETTDEGIGILQVFINGVWGTVCGDNFRLSEARAACRQLGYEDTIGYATVSSLQ